MSITTKIAKRWGNASSRSKLAVKNIILSICLKCTSIVTSLLVVPLTIHYVDSIQYGIWLAISSIVAWVNFFDLGLANGFKNRFAEAKANGDIKLAREYVSTTYAVISIIVMVLLTGTLIANKYIDWAGVLNVDQEYSLELRKVFGILAVIFCINMITQIFSKLVEADQRPAISSVIVSIGQILSLLSIFILTKVSSGSLVYLAIFFSSIPMLTFLISSLAFFYFSRYKVYRPSIGTIRFRLIRNIMGLGIKFFMIYLCLIAIFQLMNIILSRECGPVAVTQYNISYKYFSVAYMISLIIVGPMWAAFTDAYAKEDYEWMRSMLSKLEKGIIIGILVCIAALLISPLVYKIWLQDSVVIPLGLSISVMIYVISQIAGAVYMNLINGCGTMKIQFLIYLFFAIVTYPLMTVCCRLFGIIGIIIIPTLVYLIQAILGRVQISKIINHTAKGIWLK